MTEREAKAMLFDLELAWQEEYRKIKKYRLLMQGAQKRLTEIEKKIKEIPKTY